MTFSPTNYFVICSISNIWDFEKTIKFSVMQLNFKQIGETGRPILILHGVFGFLDNWLTIGKKISEEGFKVYLLDQRHHGRSSHEGTLDYPTFAKDLHAFIDQQKIEDPILIGHSMGGKSVMQYAVTYPGTFSALVVVDIGPKAYPIHHTKILKGLNAIPVEEIESRNQADEILSEYEPILPVRQFLLKNLYRKDEGGFGWRFNLPLLTSDMANVGVEITSEESIEVPAMFIRGEKSNYVLDEDIDEIRKLFPKARLVTIADAGHWLQAEKPNEFVASLLGFIKDIT